MIKSEDFITIAIFIAIGFGLVKVIQGSKANAAGMVAGGVNNSFIGSNPYTDLTQQYLTPTFDSTKGTIYL